VLTDTAMLTVTDADFAETVLGSDKPVLVYFWATWCPSCRMIAPVLAEIARDHAERLVVAKLDIDENPQTPTARRVMAVPTLQVYRGGELVKALVGARTKTRLMGELEDIL
jgi:thioredoxin